MIVVHQFRIAERLEAEKDSLSDRKQKFERLRCEIRWYVSKVNQPHFCSKLRLPVRGGTNCFGLPS